MGRIGPVFSEDPFEIITRIEFSRGLAVLDLSYTSTLSSGAGSAWVFVMYGIPPDVLEQFQIPNSSRDAGNIPITRPADLSVVNPVSKDMRTRGLEWSTPSSETRVLVFFNPATLTPKASDEFEFFVNAPGSIPAEDTTIYWVWGPDFIYGTFENNLAHPYSTGDGHGNVVQIPLGFDTEAERTDFLSVGFIPPFSTHETTEHADANNVYWTMKFATYRTSNFKLSGLSTPAWTKKATDSTIQSASGETTGSKVTFRFKKNLTVSSSKEPRV